MNNIINLKKGLKMKEETTDLSEFNSRMKKFNNCFLEKINKIYKSLVSLIKKDCSKLLFLCLVTIITSYVSLETFNFPVNYFRFPKTALDIFESIEDQYPEFQM